MTRGGVLGIQGRGAYGLRLDGVDAGADHLLLPAESDWPVLTVVQDERLETDRDVVLTEDHMRLPLGDGVTVADLRRDPLQVTLSSPEPLEAQALVHPLLAFPCAAANRWLGRDGFHAGAVVVDGGAWVVSGDKEQGKTSLLALLALQGLTILSDDIAVISRGEVLNGPACLDLRQGAAERLGIGEPIGVVGARARWRHVLPAPPPRVELRGFISLAWADGVSVDVVPPLHRLPLLFANQAIWRDPPDPARFLAYAALPSLRFSRPRSWDAAQGAAEVLVERCRRLVS